MLQRLFFLAFALFGFACAGCCEQRVWLCDDGQCGDVLGGRYEDCSTCNACNVCGEMPGHCRCGFFARMKRRLTCGEGCGELYWGDWISDPPPPCDPCDECTGDFLGRRCCPPKKKMHFGGRYCDGGCPHGACACGSHAAVDEVMTSHSSDAQSHR